MSPIAQSCHAVMPAAGIGARMGGGTPKQYLQIAGRTLLEYSLQALLDCPAIESIAVALHPQDSIASGLALLRHPRIRLAEGGAQRSDSVLAGIEALSGYADKQDWVLVHDAARPCLEEADLERLIAAVTSRDCGGILAEPIVDTVKQADDGDRVLGTLDRSGLWRAQTPQMFRLAQLREALQRAASRGDTVTDEASAMELAGYPVQLVAGSRQNLKVTVPEDLALANWYLTQRAAKEN